MGKYSARETRQPLKDKDRGPHAVWRGIGCLMILLIPILSIALGVVTIDIMIAREWSIPYPLVSKPAMPDFVFKLSILRLITAPIRQIDHFYGYAAAGLTYMIAIGGLMSFVYALVYRAVGPARYGPFDAPPPKIKTKRYTR